MSALLQTFNDRPVASAFGLAGLALLAGWPLLHTRAAILTAQLGIGLSYLVHYLLLEAWTGAAVTAVGASQSLVVLLAQDRPTLRPVAWAFLPAPALIAWSTWSGIPTVFAAIALTMMMVGRLQRDEIRLRAVLLAATPFGITHDLLIGSLPAAAGAAVAFLVGSVVLWRRLTDATGHLAQTPLSCPLRLSSGHWPRVIPRRHRNPRQWSFHNVART